ncbi:hypothetical protein BJ944DRAFT_260674 [Cunninghamella echinulata]|nr:hypothetical protein BJ944DRAFT_260674 [Cunninghamella echinulata]
MLSRRRKKKSSQSKDQFIDLAYEAIQEAELEEDRKGVIEEVIDALINATDLPLVAEVIAEQLTSQDVIERTAEKHFIQGEELRTSRTATPDLYHSYKETDMDINEIINKEDEEKENDPHTPIDNAALLSTLHNNNNNNDIDNRDGMDSNNIKTEEQNSLMKTIKHHYDDLSDYLWRFFRLLILACLVALIYQYYQHYSFYFSFLFL